MGATQQKTGQLFEGEYGGDPHRVRLIGNACRISELCRQCVRPWEVCPNACPDALELTAA